MNDDTLNSWHIETRELYFNIDRSLRVVPKLQNTRGDAMEFHRLVYEVSSTDAAFRKRCDLSVIMTPEDQEIPALGGKTPREAVKSADGCEAVEALLKDAEHRY